MPLITFIPSVRKILFFQKKIKQLNVEFIEIIVPLQNAAICPLSNTDASYFEVVLIPMKTNPGMDSTTRQVTASKQLDIFFKENVFFISGDIPLFLRLFLAIVNNL
jgi:hypothetical protein